MTAEEAFGTSDAKAILLAVQALRAGRPVVMPTETVYGLAVDARNERAVQSVFALKGRPADNPLIVHVADASMVAGIIDPDAHEVLKSVRQLGRRFWPGPLSLVLPRRETLAPSVTGGRTTVAVRVPDHPVALALLRAFGGPLAAPSANRSGSVSPTSLAHVRSGLGPSAADLVMLEGGACRVGLESTVLDLTTSPPRILRPGAVRRHQIESVLGAPVEEPDVRGQDASPGTDLRHYAPARSTAVLAFEAIEPCLSASAHPVAVLARRPLIIAPPHRLIGMPSEPEAYARVLYASLHEADRSPFERIVIEAPPAPMEEDDPWRAVRDRLRRAAATTDSGELSS